MKILVTGAAGFIGFHLTKALLNRGDEVYGLDNINNYYDVNLKHSRLEENGIGTEEIGYNQELNSSKFKNHKFVKLNLEDREQLFQLFENEKFDVVCHLAAQAGVRYSIENPFAYIDSNLMGFANVLEASRKSNIKHLVYGSSSSIYGLNESIPFSTSDNTNHPISLYAATKKSNELMAHTYSHLYDLPTTGIRFFTVYGPWGRPDMAYFKFADKIMNNEPIDIYNNGKMKRDFTYIDDIIKGIVKITGSPALPDPGWSAKNPSPETSSAAYKVYNIGNNRPVDLMIFIELLEEKLGKKAKKNYLPIQPGDVEATWANIDNLVNDFEYRPTTQLEEGIANFVNWYKSYYNY